MLCSVGVFIYVIYLGLITLCHGVNAGVEKASLFVCFFINFDAFSYLYSLRPLDMGEIICT